MLGQHLSGSDLQDSSLASWSKSRLTPSAGHPVQTARKLYLTAIASDILTIMGGKVIEINDTATFRAKVEQNKSQAVSVQQLMLWTHW